MPDLESSKTETNDNTTTKTPEATDEVDVSRFSLVSSNEIQELKSVAVSTNTSRCTKPRMNVFQIPIHARESSLDDYDEIDENQRKELSHILSHIISEYSEVQNQNTLNAP